MLAVRGHIENRQAIIRIGIQPLVLETYGVEPAQTALQVPIKEYKALIDTGAQRTCLSKHVLSGEQLISHGKRPIQSVNHVAVHRLYWIRMGFWCEDVEVGLALGQMTYFALPAPIEAMEIEGNHFFDAILGMDVLGGVDFTLRRGGEFELRLG